MLLWPGLGTIRRIRGENEDGTEGGAETDAQDGTKSFTSASCGRAKPGQREEAAGRQESRAAEDSRPRRGDALDAPQEAGV
jgi:hypothetical protein